jgi:hypothetical protein
LDMIFTIGAAISAGLFIYGGYLAIHYALFLRRTARECEKFSESRKSPAPSAAISCGRYRAKCGH